MTGVGERAEGTAPGLASRQAALAILGDVLGRARPLDEALAGSTRLRQLAGRDRAFARLMVATVLRRLGQIGPLIDRCLERPLPKAAGPALDLLRLGVAQLAFLGTPPHAAVETAVSLAPPRFKGLVNAVLRRLAREAPQLIESQDAEQLNTPQWLWRSWSTSYGEAGARAIARAHQAEPPLDLVAKSEPQSWAGRMGGRLTPTGAIRVTQAGVVTELEGYEEGAWWVQDAAAALPARLLGPAFTGRRVLDLCAAPGGKTAQLAAMGANVTAVDRSGPRLRRMAENLSRLKLEAELVEADASQWSPGRRFEAVLLDAPCSATGTIRRHPDLPWLKTEADVARLEELQDRLLAQAIRLLEPGGTLVYAVCSLESAEGPERIVRAKANEPRLQPVPIEPGEVDGEHAFLAEDGGLRTLPSHWPELGGLDGFYAHRFRLG